MKKKVISIILVGMFIVGTIACASACGKNDEKAYIHKPLIEVVYGNNKHDRQEKPLGLRRFA